ncbi:hypothetical protein P3S68_007859 [Capsicum galapagoense]
MVATFYDYVPIPKSLQVECFTNVTFNHLKEVNSKDFVVYEPELQRIKFLLAKIFDANENFNQPLLTY